MKMGPIHPEENKYNWAPADEVVNFALTNGMKMRGHTLCWHNQTPAWLFKDETGKEVSKEVLLNRLKDHITAVVTRYKGKIYAWDVVTKPLLMTTAPSSCGTHHGIKYAVMILSQRHLNMRTQPTRTR